jgi:predicted cupin superfamily sugar epimerase
VLPLYASLVCFLLRETGGFYKRKERGREGGEEGGRESVRIHRLTFYLFLKKKEEGGRECVKINRLTFYVF